MGIDQWRDEPDWPLPDTTYVDYHLDSAGEANTADGDGVLRTHPASTEAVDTYAYDPAGPAHAARGAQCRLSGRAQPSRNPARRCALPHAGAISTRRGSLPRVLGSATCPLGTRTHLPP